LIALLVAGCGKKEPEVIKIGHLSPLTGENARWGKWESEGIDLAVEEINSEGGIKGRRLEVIHEDDKGDATTGVSAFQKLLAQRIQIVIGATLSGVTLACAPIAEQNKVVLLSPSAQSPKISEAGDYVFRIFASSTIEGAWLAELAKRFKVKTAAILYANIAYGVGLHQVIREKMDQSGIKILAEEGYNPDNKDFRPELQKIKNARAEAIFLLGFPTDMGTILRQLSELGIKGLKFAPNSFEDAEIINIAQRGAEGVYYVYPILSDIEQTREVANRFRKKYNKEMNYYNGVGYDAVKILSLALESSLEESDGVKGELVKNALYKIKDFPGVTGPITFDKNGDVLDRPMEFRVVKNGKFSKLE